jgi:hypothetical protein
MSDTVRSSGGIIVPVSTDLSQLKKGLEEVKRVGANPDLLKITPQLSFEERQVAVQVNKIIRQMQTEAAKASAKVKLFGEETQAVELKPRFSVKEQSIRDAMAKVKKDLRASVSKEEIDAEVKLRVKAEHVEELGPQTQRRYRAMELLPEEAREERQRRARELRRTRNAEPSERELVAGTGSHDGGLTGRDFIGAKPTQRAAAVPITPEATAQRIAGVATAVTAGASVLGGAIAVGQAATESDPARRQRSIDSGRDGIRSLPVFGNAIDNAGHGIYSVGSSFKNALQGNGFHSDEEIAQRTIEDVARDQDRLSRKDAQIVRRKGIVNTRTALAAEGARLRGDDVGAVAIEGQDAIDKAPGELDAQVRANVAARLKLARQQHDEAMAQVGDVTAQAGYGQRIAAANFAGNGKEEFAAKQEEERAAQQSRARTRSAGARNVEEANAANQANGAEAAALMAKQAVDADDERRHRAVDSESAIAAAREATLRTSKKGYEADLDAFDAETKQKLSLIRDVEANQNESNRRAAQRQVLVFQQQQQLNDAKESLASAGTTATMRANRQNLAADLKAFDDATKQAVDNADVKLKPSVQASREEQRAALVKEQTHAREEGGFSLASRREQAAYYAKDESAAAAIAGTIAAQRAELRNATDVTDKGALAQTQFEELKAQKQSLMRPRGYLQATDPLSEMPGGPGGDEGQQMVDILGQINQRMQELIQQGGGAVLQ